jgi:hypothetical protein
VDISRYKIEFEKNGKNWIQTIGQSAGPEWKS